MIKTYMLPTPLLGKQMSKIETLLQERKTAKSKLIASTVRIPEETHSFVEELADHLGLSKQETLTNLLDDGVDLAKKALKLDDEVDKGETKCKYHLLNTNKRHNIEDTKRMLEEEVAAAFYSPWKLNINRIKSGDVVFLYENGVGIIAYGHASGKTLVRDYNGDADEFHYQHLDNFQVLKEPIKASEAKRILNANIVFLRTMVSVSDGEKLFDVAESREKILNIIISSSR